MEIVEDIHALPPLEADCIHIWGLEVPKLLDRMGALASVLNDQERQKAGRYHREADRHSSIAARGALRLLISGYTGLPASAVEFTYTGNGKPHLPESGPAFNVSHSGEWVVLALGRGREIGVDIERIKRDMDVEAIASRYFTPEERQAVAGAADPSAAFFRIWARKEAYVKASGSTLFTELKRISVPAENGAEREGWFFHDLEAGSNYAAAVVTDKPLVRMSCYDFGGLKCLS